MSKWGKRFRNSFKRPEEYDRLCWVYTLLFLDGLKKERKDENRN